MRYSISLAQTNVLNHASVKAPTKMIRRGRVVVAALVTLFTASMSAWFLIADHKMDKPERCHLTNNTLAYTWIPVLQILNFFMLTVSIILLYFLLEK